MTTQQTHLRPQVQLPPHFQPHPENAAAIVTIEQAVFMIKADMLTLEGAYYLFPPYVWPLLPKPTPKQPKRWSWLNLLRRR
jgi:hypothetical protein